MHLRKGGAVLQTRKPVLACLVALFAATIAIGPFAAAAAPPPDGVPPCDVPGQITPHPINWYSVKLPRFPSGAAAVSEFAVEPLATDRIYVTNGTVVMRSTDSGCHWSKSYELPASGSGPTATTARILEIEPSQPGVVYLPIQQHEPTTQPHVAVTRDAGESWSLVDGPVLNLAPGRIRDFDASLGNGSAAAMLVDIENSEPAGVSISSRQALFVTESGGTVWEIRDTFDRGTQFSGAGSGASINAGEELSALSVNPLRPNEIWLYGEAGVFLSNGQFTNPIDLAPVSVLDVSLDGQAVLAYARDGRTASLSFDAGQTFQEYDTGFVVDSLDMALGRPPVAALSGMGNVFYQVPLPGQAKPVTYNVTPLDGRAVSDVQVGVVESAQVPSIFGRTADTLEVSYRPVGDPVEIPKGEILATLREPPDVIDDNRLTPSSQRLTLRAGGSRTVPYRLELPAATTPLDVYFMIDVSGSMDGTISGVRAAMQEIADRLAALKIDANFGVGSFRAFNDPPSYERNRDIGPPDGGLAQALNSLDSGGGGDETQMFALLQSATGDGGSGLPKGLNMHFRPGSLRVAIEATDEPISQGGAHPSLQETIKGLRAHDVKMAGLAIQEAPLIGEQDYQDPGEPAGDLQTVAAGTSAVAPDEGVDCDGDGVPEIDPGGPLVCIISPDRADDAALMADAIVNVLQGLEDIQDLQVTVGPSAAPTSPADAVESVLPALLQQVDLKEPSAHNFDVAVHCPRLHEKTIHPLTVTVWNRGAPLARAALTLTCKPIPSAPEKKEPTEPLVLPFFPIAAVFPPPPRPPDTVAEPNPNPQPNPQQNVQAQTGFAMQKQEQVQVALAHQRLTEVARQTAMEDYNFTVTHTESRRPPPGFVAAAAALTAAFGYAMALQRRTQLRRSTWRRPRR